MEVKPGYKQTEVGVIPKEWNAVSFSEILEFRNGANADKEAYGKGVPFVNVLEVITKGHLKSSDIPGRVLLTKSAIESYSVRLGDLVFNRTSETDNELALTAVYMDDKPVVFGGFVIRGRPTTKELDPLFSGYAFRARSVRSQIIARGQGAIRANIGQGDLRQILIALPALPEQRAIARALSDVDALLGALDQFIAKKRDLKQAAMQQLLTGQTRLPGFHGEWEVKSLASVCSMKSGQSITSANIDDFSKYPCYGGNGLRGFTSRFTHFGGYALIGRQGALCGNVLGVEGTFFASEHAIVVTAFTQTDIRWLTCVLAEMRLNQYSESSAQPGLSVAKVLNLDVAVPPTKAEQTAIAEVLTDLDAELAALEQRRAKTRALKQGMMQELLTGRTRLV
jgi:type I restriction enzyme S subunit